MIYILWLTLVLLAFLIYYLNKNLLSISFVSTVSLLISSTIYGLLYNEIGYDISFKTYLVIVFSVIVLFMGEKFIDLVLLNYSNHKSSSISSLNTNRYYYYATKRKMVIVFIGMISIFILRFYDLYQFSLTLGNSNGLMGTLASVRLSYATGEYAPSSIIMKFAIIVTLCCEFYAYTYMYYFLYNLIKWNIKLYRLLLPLVGYLIILISTTGRSQYIFVVCIFITMIISIYYNKDSTSFKYNKIIFSRVSKISLFSIIFLMLYAMISRKSSGDSSNTLYQTLTSYFSAPIYGLDISMDKFFYGIKGSDLTFGYYTLQKIHSFLNQFGFNYPTPVFHNLPFFYYRNGGSNIYTALLFPILDYGIMGMLISRFLIGSVYSIFKRLFFHSIRNEENNISLIIFFGIFTYCSVNTYIADRYYEYFLDINTLIKYTIFSYLMIQFYNFKSTKILLK